MPAGHELTRIAIAVAISFPANQSATILVSCTLSSTPPAPATSRPAICQLQLSPSAIARLPVNITSRAAIAAALSPNFRPIAPPGNESATPGVKYSPIRTPMSARLAENSRPSSGATAATLSN
jgi:hypothetical protein